MLKKGLIGLLNLQNKKSSNRHKRNKLEKGNCLYLVFFSPFLGLNCVEPHFLHFVAFHGFVALHFVNDGSAYLFKIGLITPSTTSSIVRRPNKLSGLMNREGLPVTLIRLPSHRIFIIVEKEPSSAFGVIPLRINSPVSKSSDRFKNSPTIGRLALEKS